MPDTFDDGPDSPEAAGNREAIVEMEYLTGGMSGGMFSQPQDRHRKGRSTPIQRLRLIACIVLAIAILAGLVAVFLDGFTSAGGETSWSWSKTLQQGSPLGLAASIVGYVAFTVWCVVSIVASRRVNKQ